jgi:hypothetical protein
MNQLSWDPNEPKILQNFIHHDGILFKVYVIGETFHILSRPSLLIPTSVDPTRNIERGR